MYGVVVVFNVEMIGTAGGQSRRPKPVCLEARHGEINGITWSRSAVATAADDGTLRLWRIDGRQE